MTEQQTSEPDLQPPIPDSVTKSFAVTEDGTPVLFRFVLIFKINRWSPSGYDQSSFRGKANRAGFSDAVIFERGDFGQGDGKSVCLLLSRPGASLASVVGAAIELAKEGIEGHVYALTGVEFGYY